MTPHYTDPLVTLYLGDCLDVMRGLEADSVDSIVTDPPAGIAFMSKHWDRDKGGRTEWVAWMTDVMRECYRVLKPGGYALVWSIPRTCHWTAWAMEDAGFIIRDQLAHIFASGFPKGKAQLKPAREDWWLARKPGPLRPLGIDECRIPGAVPSVPQPAFNTTGTIYGMRAGEGRNGEMSEASGRWPSNVLLSDPELFDEPNPYVVGSGATTQGAVSNSTTGRHQGFEGGWAGHELRPGPGDSGGYSRFFRIPGRSDGDGMESRWMSAADPRPAWDWDESGHVKPDGVPFHEAICERCGLMLAYLARDLIPCERTSHPTAFLIPKADRSERNRGLTERSSHPTVKPIDLMRHLVRLVTPPGGVTLDPFLGSGTTALAASEEGFRCIGIEREREYLEIAKGRLMATPMGLGLETEVVAKPRKVAANKTTERPPSRNKGWSGGWSWDDPTDEEPAA